MTRYAFWIFTAILWVAMLTGMALGQDFEVRTTEPTIPWRAQLGVPGEGEEVCLITEANPSVPLECVAVLPGEDIVQGTIQVIKGKVTPYRAYTVMGETQTDLSNKETVIGTTLPPTVLP